MVLDFQQMFPSEDGNHEARYQLLALLEAVLAGMDRLKDPGRLTLGRESEVSSDYYQSVIEEAVLPEKGFGAEKSVEELLKLLDGHRFLNRHYVANATPLPNNASIAGNLLMVLLNGNNLWDVDGTAEPGRKCRSRRCFLILSAMTGTRAAVLQPGAGREPFFSRSGWRSQTRTLKRISKERRIICTRSVQSFRISAFISRWKLPESGRTI